MHTGFVLEANGREFPSKRSFLARFHTDRRDQSTTKLYEAIYKAQNDLWEAFKVT